MQMNIHICKMREDGLVVLKMNVSYGGKVNIMRDGKLKKVGVYSPKLSIGEVQKNILLQMMTVLFGLILNLRRT